MVASRIRRTDLAILISLIGVALTWPDLANAGVESRAGSEGTRQSEVQDAAIRDALGLQRVSAPTQRASAPIAPVVAQTSRRSKAPKRVADTKRGPDLQWDAVALGLHRATNAKGGATAADKGVTVATVEADRIRSILGLDPQPMLARLNLPRSMSFDRNTVETTTVAGDTPSRLDSPGDAAPLESIVTAEVAMDRLEPSAFVSPLPEVETPGEAAASLLTTGPTPSPWKRRRDSPSPMLADTPSSSPRRGGVVTTASLSLPPEDIETLDSVLKTRLHGQFELSTLEQIDGAQPKVVQEEDPLLSLLAILSSDTTDQARRPAVIFVAPNRDDPKVAATSADMFERIALEMQTIAEKVDDGENVAKDTLEKERVLPAIGPRYVALTPQESLVPVTIDSAAITNDAVKVQLATATPMLPKNPFAWYGDDAIDLSAPLTGHPLLVRVVEPSATRLDLELEAVIVSPMPTSASAPLRLLAAIPAIEAPIPGRPSSMVDIFDPKLDLVRRAPEQRNATQPITTPRPIAIGRDDNVILAAMKRIEAVRPTSTTLFATQLPRIVAPTSPGEVRQKDMVAIAIEESTIQPIARATPITPPVVFEADEQRLGPLQASRVALADSKLEQMRGGFETDGGLRISFGIERAVYINGSLVTTTSLNVADLSRLTAGQAQSVGLDRATLGVIQSGANNTFTPTQLAPSSVATVIQNTLNDQKIQGVTQINATVNSLDLVRKSNIQQSIQSALTDSLRR